MSSAELFLSALRAQGRITQEEYVAHTNHHHFQSLVTVYVPTWRPDTAISKAFNTVELVELILRHLKPAELLRAKGVCKGFRKIIATSPSIQGDIFTRVSPRPSPSLPPYAIRGLAISHVQVRGVPGISATFRFYDMWKYYRKTLRRSTTLRKILISKPPPQQWTQLEPTAAKDAIHRTTFDSSGSATPLHSEQNIVF
ncbi:hypothetical protein LTR17_026803 [Elasticomyces elasticus]|nr:hypothetical protein LTR17_026803 [Elasticomyces elasticus]